MMNKINNKLNPNWVTGFTDGEGSSMILLEKIKNLKINDKLNHVFK